MSFSERYGINPKKGIQIKSIDQDLRKKLWNCLWRFYFSPFYKTMLKVIWIEFYKKTLDEDIGNDSIFCNKIKAEFFEMKWNELYDLIEIILKKFNEYPRYNSSFIEFLKCCNKAHKEENSIYYMDKNGEFYENPIDNLKQLINQRPISNDYKNIDNRISIAIKKFFRYTSSLDDKKEAIRTLADICEFLRKDISENMLNKDESELFHIANKFSIRHHNVDQYKDYNKEIWYEWIFYLYLNTINTIIKIKEK